MVLNEPDRSLRRASDESASGTAGVAVSPTAKISGVNLGDSAGRRLRSSSVVARAIRACPSASATLMLRETSTRIGTTTPVSVEGGIILTGRKRKKRIAASDRVRRRISAPRCAADSGTNGLRYVKNATAASTAAARIATQIGKGEANCI